MATLLGRSGGEDFLSSMPLESTDRRAPNAQKTDSGELGYLAIKTMLFIDELLSYRL